MTTGIGSGGIGGGRIGEYRIVGEIGRTPGHVALDAVHLVLPRRALIKVMSAPTERLAIRALREPFLLETLQHPGVARVYESALLPDRRPWFARELVEGPTLAMQLATGGVDRRDVLGLVRAIADVLAHAHARGVIHAGLRPNRIIMTGRVRGLSLCIADWSDARAHDAEAIPYLATEGAWPYAAPEQVAGARIDDRADVFSLGVIAYQALTGALPFEPRSLAVGGEKRAHVPVAQRRPGTVPELAAMVDHMLALEPWGRPSSADVHADLLWLDSALASAALRVPRPRWTPQVTMAVPDYEAVEVSMHDDDA